VEPQTAPLAPKIQLFWPCPRCHGSRVDPDTGRRCTKCVKGPGWSKEVHISVSAFKRLLRAAN